MCALRVALGELFEFGNGLFCCRLVEAVFRRVEEFAVGRQEGGFFDARAVGESFGERLELVGGGILEATFLEALSVVPGDVFGVLVPAVIERQVFEELACTGIAFFVVVFYGCVEFCIVIGAFQHFVVSVTTA